MFVYKVPSCGANAICKGNSGVKIEYGVIPVVNQAGIEELGLVLEDVSLGRCSPHR